jgi:hypothetical protein
VRDVQRENVQQPDSRLTKTRQSTGHTCPWRRNPKDSSGFDLAAARRSCGKGAKENRAGGVLSPLRRIPTGGESRGEPVGASQRSPCSRRKEKSGRLTGDCCQGDTKICWPEVHYDSMCQRQKKTIGKAGMNTSQIRRPKEKKNAIDNLVQKLSEHTEKHQSEGHCNQNKKRISQIQNVNQRGKTNFSDPRCNNQNFQLTSTRFTTDPRRSPPYLPHLIEN